MGEYGTNASDVIAETIWLSPDVANDNEPFGGDDGIGGYAPLAVATGSGASAALTWVHGNHLGVPIAFTNASGAAVSAPSYTLPGFPGQTQTLSDLYYNRYRDYDSSTGRYIQADPIGLEGGSNPFQYAGSNPLMQFDPLGLEKVILLKPDSAPGSLYSLMYHIPNRPGICAVYGHMGSEAIYWWDAQHHRYVIVNNLNGIHNILMTQCKQNEPVYFLGCNAGRGENPLAQQYASAFGVETVGATNILWWNKTELVGIWGYQDPNADIKRPNFNDPGVFKVFKP